MHLHLETDYRSPFPYFEARGLSSIVPPPLKVLTGLGAYPQTPQEADYSVNFRIRTTGKTLDATFYIFLETKVSLANIHSFPPLITFETPGPIALPVVEKYEQDWYFDRPYRCIRR